MKDVSWFSFYFGMVGVLGWFGAFRRDLDREDGCLWKGREWNGGIWGLEKQDGKGRLSSCHDALPVMLQVYTTVFYTPYILSASVDLVPDSSVERHTERLQQQPRLPVRGRRRLHVHLAAGHHLGWIQLCTS